MDVRWSELKGFKKIMQLIMKNCFVRLCAVVCLLLASSSCLSAQGVVRNSGDVSAAIGVSHVTSKPNIALNSTNVTSNYAIGYNASKWVTLLGEYSYTPLGSSGGVSEYDNAFGGAVRFNLMPTKRIVPYVVGSLGDAILGFSGGGSSVSYNGFNMGIGGGASFYIHHNFGIRPEYRFQRASYHIEGINLATHTSEETVAFFYQFGGSKK